MKHKGLTLIIVVFTMLSVWFMIFYEEEKVNLNLLQIIKGETLKVRKLIKGTSLSFADIKNKDRTSSDFSNNHELEKREVKMQEKIEEVDKTSTMLTQPVKNPVISVFKVPMEDIESNMILEEKIKLASLARKISPIDYAKISNYLKEDDINEGVKKAFSLLKIRLTKNDYEKFIETVSVFIDINLLDREILKNSR